LSGSTFAAETALSRKALLPAGLRDILAPNAGNEARLIEQFIATLEAHGYDRVKPPLVEFESSLMEGMGSVVGDRVFRLMDPMSQRMMGLRADMTVQIARIASSRLRNAPRPLRLSYAGEVLRTTANQLNPEREVVQVGAEMIGSETAEADAEIVLVAVEALTAAGVEEISVDLMVPPLVPSILASLELDEDRLARLRAAIDRKDSAAVEDLAGDQAPVLARLLEATGAKDAVLPVLASLDLPDAARAGLDRLRAVADLIAAAAPDLKVTMDPVENRGFEYHTGIAFSIFARGAKGEMVRGEMGRGGRYQVNGGSDTATGVTLYMEMVLQALPDPVGRPKLFVPHGVDRAVAARLRANGHRTVQGLAPTADAVAEARRLNCAQIWLDGQVVAVNDASEGNAE